MATLKQYSNIHGLILTSASSLTLADRRLYNYLLYNAFDKLPNQLDFIIPFSELEGVYGAGAAPINRLKESLQRLLRTLIEFEISEEKWIITSLLQCAELDEAKSKLYYSYPIHCRELFTNAITLEKCLIQAHFTQKYSNLLYEILASKHYENNQMLSIEIADLRSRLHIAANKLVNFSDFDRFVLMPALKEINAYASFAVKFDTQRKGMKVTHVIFEMTSKKNISFIESAKHVIPQKRPRLFIDNPALQQAYAYLLNADTKERRKFFEMACKRASQKKQIITEEVFDQPDLWFRWVESPLLKRSG